VTGLKFFQFTLQRSLGVFDGPKITEVKLPPVRVELSVVAVCTLLHKLLKTNFIPEKIEGNKNFSKIVDP
jgi:hypothetical protein